MNMVFHYSYHTREYEDYADYDHSVSVVPYAMGQLQAMLGYDPAKAIWGHGMTNLCSAIKHG